MATNTPNLGLRKPDGVDLVNVITDIDANYDKIDAVFDAWTTYTPVWTAAGTAPALGNGTLLGRYRKVGKFLDWSLILTFGTTTTIGTGSWLFSLPTTLLAKIVQFLPAGVIIKNSAGTFPAHAQFAASNNTFQILIPVSATSTTLNYLSNTLPINAWASGDSVNIGGRLELA